jgi:hypothetical protein
MLFRRRLALHKVDMFAVLGRAEESELESRRVVRDRSRDIGLGDRI